MYKMKYKQAEIAFEIENNNEAQLKLNLWTGVQYNLQLQGMTQAALNQRQNKEEGKAKELVKLIVTVTTLAQRKNNLPSKTQSNEDSLEVLI